MEEKPDNLYSALQAWKKPNKQPLPEAQKTAYTVQEALTKEPELVTKTPDATPTLQAYTPSTDIVKEPSEFDNIKTGVGFNSGPIVAAQQRLEDKVAAMTSTGIAEKDIQIRDELVKKMNSDPAAKKAAAAIQARLDSLNKQRDDIKDLTKNKEDRLDWLEAIDRISQGLIQFAAANYGLKHGVDISGLKHVTPLDWEKMRDRAQARLKADLEDLGDMRKEATLEKLTQTKKVEDRVSDAMGVQRSAEKESREAQIKVAEKGVDVAIKQAEQQRQAADASVDNTMRLLGLKLQEKRDTHADKRDQEKHEFEMEKLEKKVGPVPFATKEVLKDLGKATSAVDKQLAAVKELRGYTEAYKVTKDDKERSKLQQNLTKSLASIGVDAADVMKKEGWFWTTEVFNPDATLDALVKKENELMGKKNQLSEKKSSLLFGEEIPTPSPLPSKAPQTRTYSADEQAALKFINEYPSDPRVPAIKAKLGL